MSLKQYLSKCLSFNCIAFPRRWESRAHNCISKLSHYFKRTLLPVMLLTSIASPIWAHEPQSAIYKLNQHLKQLHTLKAQFKQIVKSQDGQVLQRSSGQVVIKRPDHFKWHIQKPQPQTIITDGQHLWIYQPDLKQVTQRRLQKNIGQIPLLLLTERKVDLQKNFHVQQVAQGAFKLSPKKQASFSYIRIRFVHSEPQQMTIAMASGQTTHIQLQKTQFNQSVKDKQFQFEAPQDVQVINMDQQSSPISP